MSYRTTRIKLAHVVCAGVLLAIGIMSTWVLHVLGLTGDFVVVWRVWPIFGLALFTLVASILSCWLLFRMLVWKPSHEPLRPLCSLVFALALWWIDHCTYRFDFCSVFTFVFRARYPAKKRVPVGAAVLFSPAITAYHTPYIQ